MYKTPYPSAYDQIPLPHKYKMPDFTKFSGQGEVSTMEQVNSVTPQVSVHLNTDHCTPFKLKRKMWEIKSKRRGQIKVKVYKRN